MSSSSTKHSPTAREPDYRLLIVEDDAEMRALLVKALTAANREIHGAADGDEAIQRLRSQAKYDVVVSDVRMPNCDGHAVLQEVIERHQGTKVVLITAFGEVEEYMESMNQGAFEYLTKPLKLVDLTRVVNRALSAQTARPAHVNRRTHAAPPAS